MNKWSFIYNLSICEYIASSLESQLHDFEKLKIKTLTKFWLFLKQEGMILPWRSFVGLNSNLT